MSVSVSTSWNAFRAKTGTEIISELKGLGFSAVELSYNLSAEMVAEIAALASRGGIRVTSLHNFCPVPDRVPRLDALPDHYSMASLDEKERCAAVRQTKKTIETAACLGASFVVLHCGRVEVSERTRDLVDLYSRGMADSEESANLRSLALNERSLKAEGFLAQALRSLEELRSYAAPRGVCLGVETRYYIREIPSYEEVGIILKKLGGEGLCYWHDMGHAQVMENLGVVRHEDYLREYGAAMGGMHIHDLVGCSDHHAPFTGQFDFNRLVPYLKPGIVPVIEAHHPASARELSEALQKLEAMIAHDSH